MEDNSMQYPTDHIEAIDIPEGMNFDKSMFPMPTNTSQYMKEVMIPRGFIKDRISKLAEDIYAAYRGREDPLRVIVVMNGAFTFYTELF